MIVIYLKLYYMLFILLIYINENFSLFMPSEEEILAQKMRTSLHEKKTGGSNFLFEHPHGADPSSSTCVHLSLNPSTLCVWCHKWMAPILLLLMIDFYV